MDEEYCNECGGQCEGVHAIHHNTDNDEVNRIVDLIVSRGNKIMMEVYNQLKEYIGDKTD